jgi:hypothetical protein
VDHVELTFGVHRLGGGQQFDVREIDGEAETARELGDIVAVASQPFDLDDAVCLGESGQPEAFGVP